MVNTNFTERQLDDAHQAWSEYLSIRDTWVKYANQKEISNFRKAFIDGYLEGIKDGRISMYQGRV